MPPGPLLLSSCGPYNAVLFNLQGTQAPAPGQAKPEGERVKDEEVVSD